MRSAIVFDARGYLLDIGAQGPKTEGVVVGGGRTATKTSAAVTSGHPLTQDFVWTTRMVALVVGAPTLCTGCWGDSLPYLDQVGATRSADGDVVVLFEGCPGDSVERVELSLTDDSYDEAVRVLWAIEADDPNALENAFRVGLVPQGFHEASPLHRALRPEDHVLLVVDSREGGTIPVNFRVGDVRQRDVLVLEGRTYRRRVEFDAKALGDCTGSSASGIGLDCLWVGLSRKLVIAGRAYA